MIEARNLTKAYNDVVAVDDLSFDIRPGVVTGFLGPNGAGKTTTMRMILGLDRPTSGAARVNGRLFADLDHPMRTVGALLDAKAVHGGRRAYQHLLALAQSNRLPASRVDEVLALVGLEGAGRRRAGTFSLGMGQRLGIAAALLGDPEILMFDEPVNGLDPEGIVWIRTLMRSLAGEGRTVLVSSHLMSEMALTADHLIVIGKGRLIADAAVDEFVSRSSKRSVLVRSASSAELADRLANAGATVEVAGATVEVAGPAKAAGPAEAGDPPNSDPRHDGELIVTGMDAAHIGELAAANGLVLHQLATREPSLEEAFMELTASSVEYRTSDTPATPSLLASR